MEKLRECQESYNESTKKLSLVEADNGILMRQLQALMPDVSFTLCSISSSRSGCAGEVGGLID